jgi:PAB1-binding protein PBP1
MIQRLVWTNLQLHGYIVSVQTVSGTSGRWFTGILHHIDENSFDVTLKMVTEAGVRQKADPEKVIRGEDVVQLLAEEVDTRNVAKRDLKFMTDTDISAGQNGQERELVAWVGDDSAAGDGLDNNTTIGDFDQFEVNAAKFGVKSTFSEEQYTTKLDRSKLTTQQKRDAEKKSKAILGRKSTNIHVMEDRDQLTGDVDEEALYGAVVKNERATTVARRLNEPQSSDKEITDELNQSHETRIKEKKSSAPSTSAKGGVLKMNADAAEWNPNASEWTPEAPATPVPPVSVATPPYGVPHMMPYGGMPGVMIPGPNGVPIMSPYMQYPPMMNPQMMAPPQVQYGPNGVPYLPGFAPGQPPNARRNEGGNRGGNRGGKGQRR